MAIPKKMAQSSLKIDPKSADDYAVDVDSQRGLIRISFSAEADPLCYQIFTSDEAYSFAQQILRGYDKLEGLS